MEKKYEFLEHTADAKFRAYGKSVEEAFANAVIAMTSIMFDTDKIQPKTNKAVKAEGNDLQSLLVNFLSEFLYILDTEGFIPNRIASITINKKREGYTLSAIAKGDKYSEQEMLGSVKAVTYNDIEIKEEQKGKCWVQVVVDI